MNTLEFRLGHEIRNLSFRSFFNAYSSRYSFCLCADAYRETRESTRIVTAGTLSIMCSRLGNERRREQKKRGVTGKPCACGLAHLDLRPIRPAKGCLFPLFCAILALNPGGSSRRNRSIDTIFVAGVSETGTFITRLIQTNVSCKARMSFSKVIVNEHGDSQNRYR